MSTRYQGTERERQALDTYVKLMKSVRAVSNHLSRNLETYGLTLPALGVLDTLYHLGGSLPDSELRPRLFGIGLKVDDLLKSLEKRALIRRERSPHERRMVLVFLTDKGRELMEEVFPKHAERLTECLSVLSDEEQKTLGALCKRLGLHAEV